MRSASRDERRFWRAFQQGLAALPAYEAAQNTARILAVHRILLSALTNTRPGSPEEKRALRAMKALSEGAF